MSRAADLRLPVVIRGYIDGVCGYVDSHRRIQRRRDRRGDHGPTFPRDRAMAISSDPAILEVKNGRYSLLDHFQRGGQPFAPSRGPARPVVIRGHIDSLGGDDGTISREYTVSVTEVDAKMPEASTAGCTFQLRPAPGESTRPVDLSAEYAHLEVEGGRHELERHFGDRVSRSAPGAAGACRGAGLCRYPGRR